MYKPQYISIKAFNIEFFFFNINTLCLTLHHLNHVFRIF